MYFLKAATSQRLHAQGWFEVSPSLKTEMQLSWLYYDLRRLEQPYREETQNTRSVCQQIFYETEDKVSLLRRDNGPRRNMVVTVNLREQVNEFLTILSQKDCSDRTVNINKTDEWEV